MADSPSKTNSTTLKQELEALIISQVFSLNKDTQIANYENEESWIFDFRKILMQGRAADIIAELFYAEQKANYPFQIGTLEAAGIPLAASLMNKLYQKGHEDSNAFFIRKSRKKDGLMQMIEGKLIPDRNIVLVDDIINSGKSFWRQIEILENLGYRVDTIWSVMQFQDLDFYARFTNRGITVKSIFTLNDFAGKVPSNLTVFKGPPVQPPLIFEPKWTFQSEKPSHFYVVPKSQPLLDDSRVYFGSDNRIFWAINQSDGSVVWKYKVGRHAKKKSIFSNPAMYKDMIIFGAYDGNVYALDKDTGKRKWVNYEADWIGSSPAIAEDLGLMFIGAEYGVFKKSGGIMALELATGKIKWVDATHPTFTHASPLYIQKHRQVAIGSNDGVMRLYNARNGKLLWEYQTEGGELYALKTKPGEFTLADIKEGVAYNPAKDQLIFGSMDTNLYILKRRTGKLLHQFKCEFGIYSTPLVHNDKVYFTSLDKHLRCIDLRTYELIFERNLDNTRIFSSPVIINDKLYVGTNAGQIHELDPETGEETGYWQATERITNQITYNQSTKQYFLPTFANQIICLEYTSERD